MLLVTRSEAAALAPQPLSPSKRNGTVAVQVAITCHCAHCGSDAASDYMQTLGDGRRIDTILAERQPEG
jgi:hypothetical protein